MRHGMLSAYQDTAFSTFGLRSAAHMAMPGGQEWQTCKAGSKRLSKLLVELAHGAHHIRFVRLKFQPRERAGKPPWDTRRQSRASMPRRARRAA